ncbi:ABC transporter permease [Rhodococcus aerolatus]
MPTSTTSDAPPLPAAPRPDSRTLRRAVSDLTEGFGQRELWLHLGWQDIKQRYRRSVLGPIWITIATGVTAVAMGLLYSVLFQQPIAELLPHITVGLIIWNLISGAILEGSDVFISNEGLIKQLPAPLSVHVYRLVWRQLLLLGHNLIIYVVLLVVFPKPLTWTDLAAIPALALLAVNAVWVSFVFGILSTRFRDISPILFSLVQLLFFMTPIVWNDQALLAQGGQVADRARLAQINPLYHFLDIVRTPMLGGDQKAYHWYIVLGITVAGLALALVLLRRFRSRVSYWV